MALIELSNVTFAYEGSWDNVFEHLSLQLDTGWKLGLVGRNGRGKTTLLRLLQGGLPHTGRISVPVPPVCFPSPVEDHGRDALDCLRALDPDLEEWRLLRELSALEANPGILYRPFETLSGGEQTKVLLAALFLREGAYPLIDEPTNHLDLEGRRAVSEYLRRKRGFLLVSHDRAFLDGCVDHILALNRADVQVRQGGFSAWLRDKEAMDAWERAEHERLRRDIRRLEEARRRTAAWSDRTEAGKYAVKNGGLRPDRGYVGHKAAKLMKRAKAAEQRREEAVEAKSGLLNNVETADPLRLCPLDHPKRLLVEARDLAPDYGDGPVCPPVSFALARGERLALTGRNGAGKSSILKLCSGAAIPHGGVLTLASGLVVSYVPQDASFLRGTTAAFAEESGVDLPLFQTILRKLDFPRVQFEKDMAGYSAGQKKKVLLARSLCQQAHLYIWDEPLNYVDLFSRMQLEQLIARCAPAMLLVEHDAQFLRAVGARTAAL